MINLPRQARDKHRKNSKKRVGFSGPGKKRDDCCSGCEGHTGCKAAVHFEYGPSGGVETFPFGAIVYLLKNPNISQDRLGTNIEETLNKMHAGGGGYCYYKAHDTEVPNKAGSTALVPGKPQPPPPPPPAPVTPTGAPCMAFPPPIDLCVCPEPVLAKHCVP